MTVPTQESAPLLPTGRRAPAAWIAAILGSALVFSAGLMLLVAAGPESRAARDGETLTMMLATVDAPAGWDISIAETSLSMPTLTRGDVHVSFTSGIWEGSTESLVERQVELNVADPADADLPDVDEGEDRAARTVHRIAVDRSATPGDIYVIRELSVAVVMTVRGDAEDRADVRDDLETMIASLWLEELDLSVEEVEL